MINLAFIVFGMFGCSQSAENKRKSCDNGDLSACVVLGDRFQSDASATQNYKRAAELYKKACEGEYLLGCERLGSAHEKGLGVVLDAEKAMNYYTIACDGGNMRGCAGLGQLHLTEAIIDANKDTGRSLYKKSCTAKDPKGCALLGALFVEEKQNLSTAREHLTLGCKGKEYTACSQLGTMMMNGSGGDIEEMKAKEMFEMSCKNNEPNGCYGLGRYFHIYDADTASAIDPYTKACEAEEWAACMALGNIALSDPQSNDAQKWYGKACYGGDSRGCTELALLESNQNDALTLFKKACKENDAKGCFHLANRSEDVFTKHFYDKSCKLGFKTACEKEKCIANDAEACVNLAVIYKDSNKAIQSATAFEKACNLDNQWGCVGFGRALISGKGTTKNVDKGKELVSQNCSSKKIAGCTALGNFHHRGEHGFKHSLKVAYQKYGLGCNGNFQEACVEKAKMLLANKVIKPDKKLARDLLEKACQKNNILGCHHWALMLEKGDGIVIDKRKAATLYEKACTQSHLESCLKLGELNAKGRGGIKVNKKKAARLYKQSCNGGNAKGCHKLGEMLSQGKNNDLEDKVYALFNKACSGGVKESCQTLQNLGSRQ